MKREEIKKGLESIKYIYIKSNETDFKQLKLRDRIDIVDILYSISVKTDSDGDEDGCYYNFILDDKEEKLNIWLQHGGSRIGNYKDNPYYILYDNDEFFTEEGDDIYKLNSLIAYFSEKIKFVNCTPHNIKIVDEKNHDKIILELPPSGISPRVNSEIVETKTIDGIPFTKMDYSEVSNLPEEKQNTMFIVSKMVADACPERKDLCNPNTNPGHCLRDGSAIIASFNLQYN